MICQKNTQKIMMKHFLLVFITTCTVFFVKAQCPATAPTVKTFVSNNCPSSTVNLNTQAHTGAIPVNASLVWFTNGSHTGTAYATPASAAAGTYYAFYYNSTSNCYSPASTAVTVTTTACEPCTSANPVSVNLNTRFDIGAAPSGSVAEWHTSATPSASTLISSGIVSATSTPTNYWIFYRNTASNCYSPGSKVVVVSNLCCNYSSVDLTSLPQTTPPAGSLVEWYMTNNRSAGSKISDPTSVSVGEYFPFFYDQINNCYSPVGTPVLVAIDDECPTDIVVNKTGPLSALAGGTISYKIHVTNNGPSYKYNVVVKDPVVPNFTATSITCQAGLGTGYPAECPSSVTIAALQGTGLVIPLLTEGSGVTFTVTGTVGNTSGAVISNTATAENPSDLNPANNSSTINTIIYNCITDSTTYTLDADATTAANTIAVNGGTINLVYKLTSGTAISSIGTQFTVPVTYSDLNNKLGIDNQWEGLGTQTLSGNKYPAIVPKTSTGTGRLYNNLPALNNSSMSDMVTNNYADNIFTNNINNSALVPLGKFSINIGNYPATPSGYAVTASSFNVYSDNNKVLMGVASPNNKSTSGFWLKPLAQTGIRNDATDATLPLAVMPGQTYYWRYSAFSDGTTYASNNIGTANVKGLLFSYNNSITFSKTCDACYKPGTTTGGDVLDTKVGITSLGRASLEQGDNWPMVRKGGHIALESKTKAFVPNRVAFSDADNNASTPDVPVGISAANFIEGMMLYDTTNKCLKIYTLKAGDITMAWHCFITPACPD